jgi:hypothetical protein
MTEKVVLKPDKSCLNFGLENAITISGAAAAH